MSKPDDFQDLSIDRLIKHYESKLDTARMMCRAYGHTWREGGFLNLKEQSDPFTYCSACAELKSRD
jgi:hypothetical protein